MFKRIALPCTVALLALTACSGGDATRESTTTATTQAEAAASSSEAAPATTDAAAGDTGTAAAGLTVEQPWVKAVKGGMTGVFGTLRNSTDKDIKVTKAESPVSHMVQLHITEKDASGAMVMKETKEGFTVPANGTFELKPGANHIMLMGLSAPVLSGTETDVTLIDADGKSYPFKAEAREFNGAKETYGGMSMTPNQTAPTSGHTGH